MDAGRLDLNSHPLNAQYAIKRDLTPIDIQEISSIHKSGWGWTDRADKRTAQAQAISGKNCGPICVLCKMAKMACLFLKISSWKNPVAKVISNWSSFTLPVLGTPIFVVSEFELQKCLSGR